MNIKTEYIPPQVDSAFNQAKSWFKDLRFGSRPSTLSPVVKGLGLVAIGVAAGAALAYFLDPVSGEDRRRMAREKSKDAADLVSQKARDLSDQVQSTYENAKSAFVSKTEEVRNVAQSQTPDLH